MQPRISAGAYLAGAFTFLAFGVTFVLLVMTLPQQYAIGLAVTSFVLTILCFYGAFKSHYAPAPLTDQAVSPTAAATEPALDEAVPPSVVFLFGDNKIRIHSLMDREYFIWGNSFRYMRPGDWLDSPRVLPPKGFHYYIPTDKLETRLRHELSDGGVASDPLYFYIKDSEGHKFTLRCVLRSSIRGGQFSIDTQNLGAVDGWESEQENATSPPSVTPLTGH
jgi:hypothetical protein